MLPEKDSSGKKPFMEKNDQIDFGSIYQNLKEVKVLFRQRSRKELKMEKQLGEGHHRYFRHFMGQRKDLEDKLESLRMANLTGKSVMSGKATKRKRTQPRPKPEVIKVPT